MFPLQPTSKWVARSDSWDETLDRNNPNPGCTTQDFHKSFMRPKGHKTYFWLNNRNVMFSDLFMFTLTFCSWSFTPVYVLSEILTGIAFFVFRSPVPSSGQIRNHFCWCPGWQSDTFRGIQKQLYSILNKGWLTDHTYPYVVILLIVHILSSTKTGTQTQIWWTDFKRINYWPKSF